MTDIGAIEADLVWAGGRFQRGRVVRIGADGRIRAVEPGPDPEATKLKGVALLPGMVNAHSHAFQRGLRGRGETFDDGQGSFWSWREAMYDLVTHLDEARLYELSRCAFDEMLDAGITSVGEFHYLHHDATERGYGFDDVVLRAAADAGIRIVLLNAYYRQGGFDQPLEGGQRRFATASPDEYWQQMERLGDRLDAATQTLGVVAHSIRAADPDEIAALHEESARRAMVFHMHVEEQPREIEECVHRYGRPPLALLNERLTVGPRFTAVHCTHSAAADLDDLVDAGGTVCICPLTEANLGDGIAPIAAMRRAGGRICLGTDSNSRICFQEEMRWLEYVQRLAHRARGICVDEAGNVARALWEMATINGARSLGLRAGTIEPGQVADLIAIDLDAPALAGWTDESLLDAFVLGADAEVIAASCVGGRWRVLRDRRGGPDLSALADMPSSAQSPRRPV